MIRVARWLSVVVALALPSCAWYDSGRVWYESVRNKVTDNGTKPGPIRAALKGEYDRRLQPGEHLQSMMPRDYYR